MRRPVNNSSILSIDSSSFVSFIHPLIKESDLGVFLESDLHWGRSCFDSIHKTFCFFHWLAIFIAKRITSMALFFSSSFLALPSFKQALSWLPFIFVFKHTHTHTHTHTPQWTERIILVEKQNNQNKDDLYSKGDCHKTK